MALCTDLRSVHVHFVGPGGRTGCYWRGRDIKRRLQGPHSSACGARVSELCASALTLHARVQQRRESCDLVPACRSATDDTGVLLSLMARRARKKNARADGGGSVQGAGRLHL